MDHTTNPRRERGGLYAALACALVVTAVGVANGPVRYVRHGGGPWVQIVPLTFTFWDQHAISDHYFLSFFDADGLAHGRAYPHYSQPWLLALYLVLQPARWFGVSYERAQAWLCIPQFFVIVLLVVAHLRHVGSLPVGPSGSRQQVRFAVIALAVACVTTLPSFWVPFFRFNPEQLWFVPAFAFCHLAAADYRRAVGRATDWLALLAIALFAPVAAPFAIVSWILLWEIDASNLLPTPRRRRLWLGGIAVVAALSFTLPLLAIRFTPFTSSGSSLQFRSGLDGSQQYFTSMVQAVLAPSYPPGRPWQLFHWPFVALAAIVITAAHSRPLAGRMLRQLFICVVPLLWTVAVFPQLVSIHPYAFDLYLTLGAAFCLAFWLQQPELDQWIHVPALRLAIIILFTALLMTNLIDLARVAA